MHMHSPFTTGYGVNMGENIVGEASRFFGNFAIFCGRCYDTGSRRMKYDQPLVLETFKEPIEGNSIFAVGCPNCKNHHRTTINMDFFNFRGSPQDLTEILVAEIGKVLYNEFYVNGDLVEVRDVSMSNKMRDDLYQAWDEYMKNDRLKKKRESKWVPDGTTWDSSETMDPMQTVEVRRTIERLEARIKDQSEQIERTNSQVENLSKRNEQLTNEMENLEKSMESSDMVTDRMRELIDELYETVTGVPLREKMSQEKRLERILTAVVEVL